MSDLKLGQLITDENAKRDAIHIAVAPVIAGELLRPGNHIGLTGDDGRTVGAVDNPIGIVDPFLQKSVIRKGEKFWMFLYPQTVTSLQHAWEHPSFPAETPTVKAHFPPAEAVEAMEKLIASAGRYHDYNSVMTDADVWFLVGRKTEDSDYDFSLEDADWKIFWELYGKIRGVSVPENKRKSFYVCCL
jgi:hypothetical protein